MRPSFEKEAQMLAQIPDDVDDDGGVESALLKFNKFIARKNYNLPSTNPKACSRKFNLLYPWVLTTPFHFLRGVQRMLATNDLAEETETGRTIQFLLGRAMKDWIRSCPLQSYLMLILSISSRRPTA
jgi:hypothetical protein